MASADDKSAETLKKFYFKIEGCDREVELSNEALIWRSQEVTKSKKNPNASKLMSHRIAFQDVLRIQAFPVAKVGNHAKVTGQASALVIDYVVRNAVVDPSIPIPLSPFDKACPNYVWKMMRVMMFCPTNVFNQCQQVSDAITTCVSEKEKHRPKKLLVIINPAGGRKKGLSIFEKTVQPIFNLAGISTDVVVSKHHNHIHEILRTYDIDSVDGMVAVGGDGTLTQLINGLILRIAKDKDINLDDGSLELEQLPKRIGVIPAGTGNGGIAMTSGTKDAVTATLHIVLGTSCDVNLLSVHNGPRLVHYGFLLSCYGLLGDSVHDSEKNRSLGVLRYVYGIGRNVLKLHSNPLTIQMKIKSKDGELSSEWTEVKGNFVMVDNFLGDYFTTPEFEDPVVHASVTWQHGGLHLNVVKDTVGRMKIMKLMKAFAGGDNHCFRDSDGISAYTCQEYKLILTEPSGAVISSASKSASKSSLSSGGESGFQSVINIDGDPFLLDHPEVHVRLRPHMLKVFGTGLTREGNKLASDFRREKSMKSGK